MTGVLLIYLPWLLSAAAVGAVVGMAGGPSAPVVAREMRIAVAITAALVAWAAATAVIPGRYGHAFEALLWISAAYLAGWVIGDRLIALRLAPTDVRRSEVAPPRLAKPDDGGDDLTFVGVSPPEARALGELGVWRLAQIAAWTPDEAGWIAARVGVPARRVERDWIAGARSRLARSNLAALAHARPASDRRRGGSELRRIAGVGPQVAAALADLGVTRIDQVAAWRPHDVAWISERLGEADRIEREMWVAQARLLASGVDTSASITRLMGQEGAKDPDAGLDAPALAALRAELEELSAAANVAAFEPLER